MKCCIAIIALVAGWDSVGVQPLFATLEKLMHLIAQRKHQKQRDGVFKSNGMFLSWPVGAELMGHVIQCQHTSSIQIHPDPSRSILCQSLQSLFFFLSIGAVSVGHRGRAAEAA